MKGRQQEPLPNFNYNRNIAMLGIRKITLASVWRVVWRGEKGELEV